MNSQFTPIFSVVIPIYNVALYIEDCIKSVLAQTFTSFEILCIDDGSPDNSIELIEQFKDERIRIIRQSNRGLSGARNTGINHSRGMFIALLDADDLWLPNKLKAHFKHLQSNHKIGVSYSASEFIDEAGNPLGIGQHPKLHNISSKDVFCRNPIGNGSAAVLRKSLLQSVARIKRYGYEDGEESRYEYFDESMRQSEDVEFWLRVSLSTDYEFAGIKEALTLYRVNMSGLSANLENQYNAWLYAVEQQAKIDQPFVSKWFPLASAYQKRYLARRAVQARHPITAIKLMRDALVINPRILIEEPTRTLATLVCSVLCLLPENIYNTLESIAMKTLAKRLTS